MKRRTAPRVFDLRSLEPEARSAWHRLQYALLETNLSGESAPCRQAPDLFVAEDPDERRRAAARCRPCPVRSACLAYAEAADEPWGVWGGLDRDVRCRPRDGGGGG